MDHGWQDKLPVLSGHALKRSDFSLRTQSPWGRDPHPDQAESRDRRKVQRVWRAEDSISTSNIPVRCGAMQWFNHTAWVEPGLHAGLHSETAPGSPRGLSFSMDECCRTWFHGNSDEGFDGPRPG